VQNAVVAVLWYALFCVLRAVHALTGQSASVAVVAFEAWRILCFVL
jgi:hypothetical protein